MILREIIDSFFRAIKVIESPIRVLSGGVVEMTFSMDLMETVLITVRD
jgi:hypothetical protein